MADRDVGLPVRELRPHPDPLARHPLRQYALRLVAVGADHEDDHRQGRGHPATAHGADRGPAQQENESFRKARLILLPVALALLIAVFVHLRS
ncbi:hypothetical protein ACFCX0_11875 [Streptomyces sp. NPDC056352]|uniref:hypothetical protein n=1 Tax=Streptomyces sp. NPDC056352 TaxID=3345791 RepID=UPI0035E2A95F